MIKTGSLNPWISDTVVESVNEIIPEGEFNIGSIDASEIGELQINTIEVVDKEGNRSIIDELFLSYDARDILNKEVSVLNGRVSGGEIYLKQREDGQWNLADFIPESEGESEPSDWKVNLSSLALENLSLVVEPQAINGQRHIYSGEINGEVRQFQFQSEETSIDLVAKSELKSDTAPDLSLGIDASYSNEGIQIADASLSSERSAARSSGFLKMGDDSILESSDLKLNLTPLHMRDLAVFSPLISGSASYSGDLLIKGQGGVNEIRTSLEANDGSLVQARANLSGSNGVVMDYDLSSTGFDLSGITGDPSNKSAITAKSMGTLQGPSFAELTGRTPLKISLFDWPELPRMKGLVSAELNQGTFRLKGNQNLALIDHPESGVAGNVDYSLDDQGRLNLDDLSFRQIDLADFVADSDLTSQLSGNISGEFRIKDLKSASGSGELVLEPSSLMGQEISDGVANFSLAGEQLTGSASSTTSFGNFQVESFVVNGFDENAIADAHVFFQAFEPQKVIPDNESLSANLSGELTLRQGFDFDRGSLVGTLQSDKSISFDAEISSDEQFLSAIGNGRLIESGIELDSISGTTKKIDIKKFVPESGFATDLNSKYSGNLIIEDGLPSGNIKLDLSPSMINSETVSSGVANLIMDKGEIEVESNVVLGDGDFFVASTGSFQKKPYQGEILGRWSDFNLAKVLGIDTLSSNLNGAVNLTYSGSDFKSMNADGVLVMGKSFLQDIRVDTLITDFNIKDGDYLIDTLLVRSNVLSAVGGGNIYLENSGQQRDSDFSLNSQIRSLQPLAEFVGVNKLSGEGNIRLDIAGDEGSPRFEFEPELRYLAIDEAHLSELTGAARGSFDGEELSFDALLDFGVASVPNFTIRNAGLVASYENERALLTGQVTIDKDRNGRFGGILDTSIDPWLLSLENLNLTMYEDQWNLDQTASITVQDGFEITDLLMESGDQQIVVDGSIDLSGRQDLVLTLEGIKTGSFTDLLGFQGLDGTVDGWVIVEGEAADPYVEGQLTAKNISSFGRPVGSMEFESTIQEGVMNLDAVITNDTGNQLSVNGFLPLLFTLAGEERDVSNDPVGLVVKADTFDLSIVEPFLNNLPVEKLDGRMTADIQIGGIDSALDLQGEAFVNDASIGLRDFGVIYTDIEGRLDFDKTSAILNGVTLRSGDGTAKADGTVNFASLTEPVYDLEIEADKFKAIWDDTYHVFADAELSLTGSQYAPILRGEVTVSPADIFLTDELIAEELEYIELSGRDLQVLEERFGYRISEEDTTSYVFYEALTIEELKLTFDNNVWMRSSSSPEMDIEFDGDIDVTKLPNADPNLVGTVEVNPSRSNIVQFGKKFNIKTGEITLTGPIEELLINLNAEYVVPSRRGGEEVTINLTLTGRQDDLKTTLSSDPQRSTVDIISYIATGRPADESVDGTGDAVTDLAVGQLSSLVEGFAGDQLGLDVFEIEFNTTDGAEVTLGKYLSRDLYVSFSQALSEDERQSRIAMEYELYKWLLLQLERRDNSLKFNLLWEYAF